MTDKKQTLRDRLTKLRTDPRVAAFSLIGPGGQVFDLVAALIDEIDSQALQIDALDKAVADALNAATNRVRQLELQLKGLGALKVNA